jgi:hypothetical protein
MAASFIAPATAAPGAIPDQSTSFPQNHSGQSGGFAAGLNREPAALPPGSDGMLSLANCSISPGNETGAKQSAASDVHTPQNERLGTDALFKEIQDRLRQLGATYYLLESCGDQSADYRFYCRMSIGGNPQVTRSFQSTDSEPLKAMSKVLQQIEDWQKGGRSSPAILTSGTAQDLR